MKLDEILRLAEETEKEVTELCSGLVKFNSAHPEGFTDEAVDFIKKYLNKHAITNQIHAKESKKPNIVAK